MQVTKFQYETEKGQDFSATVLDINKDEALNFLRKVVKVKRVKSISSIGTVHAIGDNIIEKIINSSEQMKKYEERLERMKDKNKELEDQLKIVEYELEQFRSEKDKKQQQPSSAEIAKAMKQSKGRVYVCPYCEFETEKKNGIKMHITKQHKEKRNEDNTPENKS